MAKRIIIITVVLMTTALLVYKSAEGLSLADMHIPGAYETAYLIQEKIINSINRMQGCSW